MKHNFINQQFHDFGITGAAIAAGAAVANQGGQMIWQGKMNKKTRAWNERMYGIQREDALADVAAANKYNSPAEQVKRLKEAGLNPALMYGEGSAGGGTTIPTRGSDTGSWNPQVPKGMDIAELAQLALLKAQKENIEADTKNKLADIPNKNALTPNINADTENKKLASVIADYTGKELKDVYELVKKPNRGQESETYSKEMQARQGVLDVLRDQFENGQLATKANAEVEKELLQNAKTREETKNIMKTFDLLEANLKGQTLENAFKELDLKLQKETGVGRDAPYWGKMFSRLLMELANL